MTEAGQAQDAVIACDLTVFTPEEREQHIATANALFGAVRDVRDVPTGYAFRLPEDSAVLPLLATFIGGERRCCPFTTFAVEVEPYGGAIWLRMTGPEHYKQALAADLAGLLDADVAQAAGLHAVS